LSSLKFFKLPFLTTGCIVCAVVFYLITTNTVKPSRMSKELWDGGMYGLLSGDVNIFRALRHKANS